MKRVLALVAALIMSVGLAFIAAPAHAATAINVCTNKLSPTGPCMNFWSNIDGINKPVNFYTYGNSGGHNAWVWEQIGTVATSGSGAVFADGTDLNARYAGMPIIQIQLASNQDYCAGGIGYDPDELGGPTETSYCSDAPSDWVWTQPFLALVSVFASNIQWGYYMQPNVPIWAGANAGAYGNGKPVWLSPVQNYNLPWTKEANGG